MDREAALNITADHAIVSFINAVDGEEFNVQGEAVFGALRTRTMPEPIPCNAVLNAPIQG